MTEYTLINKFAKSNTSKAELSKNISAQSKANHVKNTLINAVLTTESIKVCKDVNTLLGNIINALTALSKKDAHAYHVQLLKQSLYLIRIASANNKLYYRINNSLITSDYTGAHESLYDLIEMEIKRVNQLIQASKINEIHAYCHHISKALVVITQWYFKNK